MVVGRQTLGRGQEFIEADVDHHAGHAGEHQAQQGVGEHGPQKQIAHKGTQGFGHAGGHGNPEGLTPAAGGVVNRRRHRQPLGNVVDGDGDGDADAQARAGEGPQKGEQPLGKVVDGDRQRREQASAQQVGLRLRVAVPAGLQGRGEGRLGQGQQAVDQGDGSHAGKQGQHCQGMAGLVAQRAAEDDPGLGQDLHERHVEHHPRREAEGDAEHAGTEPPVEQAKHAAEAGGESGRHGEQEGEDNPRIQNLGIRHGHRWTPDQRTHWPDDRRRPHSSAPLLGHHEKPRRIPPCRQ